jgi:opacity protein-like surface antigen
MRFRFFIATTLMLAAPAAHAEWYAGPMVFAGQSDNDHFERSPAQPFPSYQGGAGDNGYSGGAGALMGYHSRDTGLSLELGGDYRFRHDMNVGYRDPSDTIQYGAKSNVEAANFMLSGLYDLPLGTTSWQPFIGAGAGVAHIAVKTNSADFSGAQTRENSAWNFAWAAHAGVKFPVGDATDLRLEYRYIDYGTISTGGLATGDTFEADFYSHDVRMGVTVGF